MLNKCDYVEGEIDALIQLAKELGRPGLVTDLTEVAKIFSEERYDKARVQNSHNVLLNAVDVDNDGRSPAEASLECPNGIENRFRYTLSDKAVAPKRTRFLFG